MFLLNSVKSLVLIQSGNAFHCLAEKYRAPLLRCAVSRRHNTRCRTPERVVTAKDALFWPTRSRRKMAFFGEKEAWAEPNAATTPVMKITQEPRHDRFVKGF